MGNDSKWEGIPFGIKVARGEFGATAVNKFGYNPDVDNNEVTIFQGNALTAPAGPLRVYTNQTAPYTLWISSNNVLNNGRTYTIQGLSDTWDYQSVPVTLDTPATNFVQVGDTLGWRRMFRGFNSSSSPMSGIVYLSKNNTDIGLDGIPDDPANDLITAITAGYDQTVMAAYTVPDDKAAYLGSWTVSNFGGGGADPTTFKLRVVNPQGTTSRVQKTLVLGAGTSEQIYINPPLRYPARADIEITAMSTGAGSSQDVTGEFDIVLMDE